MGLKKSAGRGYRETAQALVRQDMKMVTHSTFGPLTWDSELEGWQGSCVVDNSTATLRLLTDGEEQIPSGFDRMYQLLQPKLPQLLCDAARWVATDLAHWMERDEDREPSTIQKQMAVTTIEIWDHDGATVWFQGPDSIEVSGHCVEARIGSEAVLKKFCLSG